MQEGAIAGAVIGAAHEGSGPPAPKEQLLHAAPAAVPPPLPPVSTAATRPARTIRPPAKLVETPTLPVAKARGRKPGSKNKGGRAPGAIAAPLAKMPAPKAKAAAAAAIGKANKPATAAKKAKAADVAGN